MIEDRKIVIGNINAKYVVMCIGINQNKLDMEGEVEKTKFKKQIKGIKIE